MSANETNINDELKAQLTETNKIGSGQFGLVYKVTKDHIEYALKEIQLTGIITYLQYYNLSNSYKRFYYN